MNEHIVRIGGASGAWGDSPRAVPQLLKGPIDYLMMDYLAEVSMSLLARARMKAPEGGFPPDFIAYLKDHLPDIAERRIRIVSNGGGVNPRGCAAAMQKVCEQRYEQFRTAGNASKLRPLQLHVMAQQYKTGSLDPKTKAAPSKAAE